MKIIENPKKENWSRLLQRPTQSVEDIENTVNQIFLDVKQHGDFAVNKYTSIFDGIELDDFVVSEDELKDAEKNIQDLTDKFIALVDKHLNELVLSFHPESNRIILITSQAHRLQCFGSLCTLYGIRTRITSVKGM